MTEAEVLKLYQATGGLLRGHFLLTSGLHSDTYLQSALVLQDPRHAETLCRELALPFGGDGVQAVVAPALGGSWWPMRWRGPSVAGRSLPNARKKAALATLTVPTYQPLVCPLCKGGTPAVKPGSRK